MKTQSELSDNQLRSSDQSHDQDHARTELIRILREAYSGELAAALAYRGHWKSVSDSDQRQRIQQIEAEELVHRSAVGKMLLYFGKQPSIYLEVRLWLTGRIIAAACHLIGWFLPMFFAGRLESSNWKEYESAAGCARTMNLSDFEAALRRMSEVELEHQEYFASMVTGHRLLPLAQSLFKWDLPVNNRFLKEQPQAIPELETVKGSTYYE